MRLNAPQGQKVRYLNKNGYDVQREFANKYLNEGAIYTVKEVCVYGSSSDVVLEEVPNESFNTVMFEEIGDILPATLTVKELYDREYTNNWGVTKE